MKQINLKAWPLFVLLFLSFTSKILAQRDTLSGFDKKRIGDEISYFSPLRQFAKTALLSRCNGQMPIEWESKTIQTKNDSICLEFLIGHSSGTSGGIREFELSLNQQEPWLIVTQPKQSRLTESRGSNALGNWHFVAQEFDINGDIFGKLYLTIPSSLVKNKAEFRLIGRNHSSRDWMMIFMYSRAFRAEIYASQLVRKDSNKSQLQIGVENPFRDARKLEMHWNGGQKKMLIQPGFNVLQLATFNKDEKGKRLIKLRLEGIKNPIEASIELKPSRMRTLHIIHHSHNDIGYSHHQTEVEKIQTENIRAAIRWTSKYQDTKHPAYWHIESLWAVENFMNQARPAEQDSLMGLVKKGFIVLSGNYANILTGLCRPEEQKWALEYAKQLKSKYQLPIQTVMTTDIPGISASAMQAYWEEGFSFLSMGPNYVKSYADKGDRIGSMLEAQGDKILKWKPNKNGISDKDHDLYVWTAGKGYSMLHGITEAEKQNQWEQRISDYLIELEEQNHPFEDIQLRYTKNADNGPVDTNLVEFVEAWNQRYESPKLRISSLPELFKSTLAKHEKEIPEWGGEISPYWEDGAYSTAAEEIEIRQLVKKIIQLSTAIPESNKEAQNQLYQLKRNLVLFHEHTWGAWCSISDPDLEFTTSQWEFKKAFLDSARIQYTRLEKAFGTSQPERKEILSKLCDFRLVADSINGGFWVMDSQGKPLFNHSEYRFFEPVYMLGINPMKRIPLKLVSSKKEEYRDSIVWVQEFKGELIHRITVRCSYSIKTKTAHFETSITKPETREKESLHMAIPLHETASNLKYNKLSYPNSQLPGSNREFICVEDSFQVTTKEGIWHMYSPEIALLELGSVQNENQVNGTRLWKREAQSIQTLFLYVLNNYWHTNYKAGQGGSIRFRFAMKLENAEPN